jgi:hypothetical protein
MTTSEPTEPGRHLTRYGSPVGQPAVGTGLRQGGVSPLDLLCLLDGFGFALICHLLPNSAAARPSVTLVDYRTHEAGPVSHVIRFPRGSACRRFETTPGRSSLGLPSAKLRGRKALGDQRFSSITQHWTRKSAATLGRRRQWAPPTRLPPLRLNPAWDHSGSGPTSCDTDSDDRVSTPTRSPNRHATRTQSAAGFRNPNPGSSARAAGRAPCLHPWVTLPGPPPGMRTTPTQVRHTPQLITNLKPLRELAIKS